MAVKRRGSRRKGRGAASVLSGRTIEDLEGGRR
jgi:hypothetical protein